MTRTNQVPDEIKHNLLKDSSYIVAGGELTVSNKVVDSLVKDGIKTTRIAGKTRFDTSKAMVDNLCKSTKSYLIMTDKVRLIGIVSAPMSVKYKKPLLIQKTDINGYAKDNMDKGYMSFILKNNTKNIII